jgi:hypothetical protein
VLRRALRREKAEVRGQFRPRREYGTRTVPSDHSQNMLQRMRMIVRNA